MQLLAIRTQQNCFQSKNLQLEIAPPQKWLLSTFTSTETVEFTSTECRRPRGSTNPASKLTRVREGESRLVENLYSSMTLSETTRNKASKNNSRLECVTAGDITAEPVAQKKPERLNVTVHVVNKEAAAAKTAASSLFLPNGSALATLSFWLLCIIKGEATWSNRLGRFLSQHTYSNTATFRMCQKAFVFAEGEKKEKGRREEEEENPREPRWRDIFCPRMKTHF